MANFFKKLFGKDEKTDNKTKNPKTTSETELHVKWGEQLAKPSLTDEEEFAMGTMAISLVGGKINTTKAMVLVLFEFKGYNTNRVKSMLNSVTVDYPKAVALYEKMVDPKKRNYAAGFAATLIKFCGAEENPDTVEGWNNFVNSVLHLSGDVVKSIDSAMAWYYKHHYGGVGNPDGRWPKVEDPDDDHTSVDLVLPSGLLWATYNLGANKPEEHGLYFQWGNTEKPHEFYEFSQRNMPYCRTGIFVKYNTHDQDGVADHLMVLDAYDDAASVNWSKRWRTPTKEEYMELIENCIWEWKQQNGVNGYLVSSKKNGNSLFFPTTGFSMDRIVKDAHSTGCYWTSSLHNDEPIGAWGLDFNATQHGKDMLYRIPRFLGLAIRPVCSSKE